MISSRLASSTVRCISSPIRSACNWRNRLDLRNELRRRVDIRASSLNNTTVAGDFGVGDATRARSQATFALSTGASPWRGGLWLIVGSDAHSLFSKESCSRKHCKLWERYIQMLFSMLPSSKIPVPEMFQNCVRSSRIHGAIILSSKRRKDKIESSGR